MAEVFYVYVRNGAHRGLLAGPFDTRDQANGMVEATQREAVKLDSMAHFYEYGSVPFSVKPGTKTPAGRLNGRLGLPTK